jgi:hypothetical protein
MVGNGLLYLLIAVEYEIGLCRGASFGARIPWRL